MEIVKVLADAGVVGVTLALIAVLYKIVANHINHSNDIFRENTSVMASLKEIIQSNTEAIKDLISSKE